MKLKYRVIYSSRKTLALEITQEREVLVRAPLGTCLDDISAFATAHRAWISKAMARMEQRQERHPEPEPSLEAELRAKAEAYLPQRIAYYSDQMGLYPEGVRITGAKTRFGSCSGKNRLCFSWRLMAYPEAAIDYVVVHELAHILHKHHGPSFYACVAEILPDWRARRSLLR